MKSFDFEGPDGKIHTIEGPDDATPEQAFAALQIKLGTTKTTPTIQQNQNPILETIGNIPESAGRFISGITQTVAHPLQTGSNLLNVAAGGLQNLLAPESFKTSGNPLLYSQQAEQAASAVGQFYKERYGGIRNIGETIKTDPVGFAADVSVLTGLGAGLTRGTGLAKPLSTVAKVTNPLYLPGKAVKEVAGHAYQWGTGMTTSAGYKAVGEAIKGSKEFKDAMRGNVPESQVLQNATDALDSIKESRRLAYQTKLSNLKNATQQIPINDIKSLANNWLKRFNVKKVNGELDFSRSTVTGTAANEVKDIYNMVQEWGSKAGDNTPAMLDVLKRRIGDYYSTNRNSRAMVSNLEKAVKDKIISAVPDYADMVKEYAKSSEVINDIEKAFSLKSMAGGKAASDTAIRKLITAIREDNTFRKSLLETMDKSGGNVTGAASGLLFKSPWSHRIGPMFTLLGGGLAALASPKLAALIPLSSPRLIGELSVLLGQIGRTAPIARGTGITAYQAGRLPMNQQDINQE